MRIGQANAQNYQEMLRLFLEANGVKSKSTSSPGAINNISVSSLNDPSVQAQLRQAGIDTNSAQFKTVANSMMEYSGAYTNIQAIKNRMSNYDSDGDWIDPRTGLAGLLVTAENDATRKTIIDIPESSRQEMFDLTKREFIQEYGVANGDTTRRSDVYTNLYRKMQKNDRLKAGYTMQQYERAYHKAFVTAVREVNPKWQPGDSFDPNILNNITRESVENSLMQSGNTLVKKSLNTFA